MGQEYVVRLEVAVHFLAAVQILEGLAQFARDAPEFFFRGQSLCEELAQRLSVHPFQLDAIAKFFYISELVGLANPLVPQGIAQLELLTEHSFLKRLTSPAGLQALVYMEAPVPLPAVQLAEALLRRVDEGEV